MIWGGGARVIWACDLGLKLGWLGRGGDLAWQFGQVVWGGGRQSDLALRLCGGDMGL